jgi:hypothetical protein
MPDLRSVVWAGYDAPVVAAENPRPEDASGKTVAPLKRLPTPRIAYPKQLDLLRAYAAASGQGAKPVDNEGVATLVKMSPATVSLANPFFADVGFLERVDGGYLPDKSVLGFARVHAWNPEKAGAELAQRLAETWFAQTLIPRLQYAPVSEEEALIVLASEAGAAPAYRSQVRTLLDYLETAGLIIRENGQVKRGVGPLTPEQPSQRPEKASPEAQPQLLSTTTVSAAATPGLPLLIQGLLQQLPEDNTWTREGVNAWLDLAEKVFQVVYGVPPKEAKHSEER